MSSVLLDARQYSGKPGSELYPWPRVKNGRPTCKTMPDGQKWPPSKMGQ
jgi:hypothetical protein